MQYREICAKTTEEGEQNEDMEQEAEEKEARSSKRKRTTPDQAGFVFKQIIKAACYDDEEDSDFDIEEEDDDE